jgi:hypothetical protein
MITLLADMIRYPDELLRAKIDAKCATLAEFLIDFDFAHFSSSPHFSFYRGYLTLHH